MKREIADKIRSCKALSGKSVADVVDTPEFLSNLAAYMKAQREEREAARESYEKVKAYAPGFHLPAHPIDKCINLTPEDFAVEYLTIVAKRSQRPKAERDYIFQLGRQAYNLTIAQIVCREFPELEAELLNNKNQN